MRRAHGRVDGGMDMKLSTIRVVLAATVLVLGLMEARAYPSDSDALYLLSGTFAYGASLPVNLYCLDANAASAPSLVRQVADGMNCVLEDHERRRLVVGTPAGRPTDFQIINMDMPSKHVLVRIPYDPEDVLPGAIYLLDAPQKGDFLALALGRKWKEPFLPYSELTAAEFDVPDSPIVKLPLDRLGSVRVSGFVGGALPGQQQIPEVRGDPLHILLADPKGWSLGLPRPAYWHSDPATEGYLMVVNNDVISVLASAPGGFDLFNKKTKEWSRVSMPFTSTRIRGFGPWVAAIAEESAPIETKLIAGGTHTVTSLPVAGRESPGARKRRKMEIGPKMTVDSLFQAALRVYPGKLMIFNAVSGAMLQISTGEGDSEVLLATDEAVFYRVNDSLYRASVSAAGLGKPVKLAEGAEIVQAHWAFLGPVHKN
jgi:hypothetical protein